MTETFPTSSPPLTHDRWYDGSLTLWQPEAGFRATTDAVLLAASIPDSTRHAIELGAGGGAASLALAMRFKAMRLPSIGLEGLTITAVERDPLMAELLHRNIAENGFADSIRAVEADIFDPSMAKAWQGRHDLAFCNPPYNDVASSQSGDARRRGAVAADDLGGWVDAALGCLAARGRIVMISRSDRLDEILAALSRADTGEVVIRPVHGQVGNPAIRVLMTARKGISGPMTLLPPLVLRQGDGLTPEMERISHQRAAIDLLAPGRKQGAVRLENIRHSR